MSRFSFNLDSLSRKQKYASGKFDAWLHSKLVLYVVSAASLFQLFILANSGNYKGVISFVLVAVAVMFFLSKNMVVVLVSAFAACAIFGILPDINVYGNKEGMEDGADSEDSGENKDKDTDKKDKKKESKAKEDSKVIADLKRDGESLIKTQETIMKNFEKISPELDKVESLVESMNQTAATLSNPEIKEKLVASMVKPK